jgi:hypothetical protein
MEVIPISLPVQKAMAMRGKAQGHGQSEAGSRVTPMRLKTNGKHREWILDNTLQSNKEILKKVVYPASEIESCQ